MKRQPTDWEKMLVNDVANKRLISKIYKLLMQLSIKNAKQPNQKMGQRAKHTFLQKRCTEKKHMKRCSTSL